MRRQSSGRTLWRTPDATPRGPKHHPDAKAGNHSLQTQVYLQTSETLTEPPSEEQLYLPAGFLASHFPRPGSAQARKMTATSGRRCSELYHKPGPLGSLVRTLLDSSRWSSTSVFLTWKVKATPANRLLFQLAPSMPDTGETECGLLPTVTETMNQLCPSMQERYANPILWATPTEQDSSNDGGPSQYQRHSLPLNAEVKMWPTPCAQEDNKSPEAHMAMKQRMKGGPRNTITSLQVAAKMWPTPKAVSSGDSQTCRHHKPHDLQTAVNGSLNPTWVEWLMGYPLGWTALKDSAMRSFRRSRMKS